MSKGYLNTSAGKFVLESYTGKEWLFQLRDEETGNCFQIEGERAFLDLHKAVRNHLDMYIKERNEFLIKSKERVIS